ncbi:prepilin-type N-terminal cleavage/methylation domain-containing protein [Patescibacteria group bacterium]|nr:prepilin-type N-terminal cleavage/methylation domain-containing protein [Patescibacteria group bacterium]
MKNKGFTLIEILVVIGIIAILAAVAIVAINPARQFAQANNAQRWSNVNTILNAVYQYAIDNNGSLPSTITAVDTEICETNAASCTGLIDLSDITLNELYLVSMPLDPQCPDACLTDGVGYTISTSANGRVIVIAPDAQLGETIKVTR